MLKVQSISFGFAHLPLFSNISLHAQFGEVLHISGPNGVGKSTFMQILAGILEPLSGSITLEASLSHFEDRRLACSYLPSEGNGLFLRRDAIANLRFWGPLRGTLLSEVDAHQELSNWGLTNPYFRSGFPVGKFSTGMKRRLALARVSTSNARIWLLDEPVYGLDAHAIALFRSKLKAHVNDKGIAIIISHDLSVFEGINAKTFSMPSIQSWGTT